MRHRYEDLPPSQWTDEEAMRHLTETFDRACRAHPDVMEPYVVLLADECDRKAVMRQGLRETIAKRF